MLDKLVSIFTIITSVIVVFTAVIAVIKFQLYEVFVRRYNTEMKVEQKYTKDGKIYLICTYIIENIGELPISLSEVELKFYEARECFPEEKACKGEETCNINCNSNQQIGTLVCFPEKDQELGKKTFKNDEPKYKDLMRISAGERAEFPIRSILPDNRKESIFIYGSFKWKKRERSCFEEFIIRPIIKLIKILIIIIARILGLYELIISIYETITYEKEPANYHQIVLISTQEK